MVEKWLYGILTGSSMVALATNSFEPDTAGVLGSVSTPGMLLFLGLGLVGLRLWGRKRVRQGTSIDGRDLVLGLRKVNNRGTSLFYEQEEMGR